jgi:hypothetical protein
MADNGVAGYFAGGVNDAGNYSSAIDKIAFPADTITTLSATLTSASGFFGAMADSGVAGYFGGGQDAASGRFTRIDKIAFPADSKTTLSATITSARDRLLGFSNQGVF